MIQFAKIDFKGVHLWRLSTRKICQIYHLGLNHGSNREAQMH